MPVMGICQDSLVGAYLITDDSVRMRPDQFEQIMMTNSNFDGTMPKPGKDGMYTGKQAVSTILPKLDMNYGTSVVIKDGQLLEGRLGKSQLGAKTNSLTHVIFNDYDPEETLRFLDNEQQVVNAWLLQISGFSVGINDCILPKHHVVEKDQIISEKVDEAYEILRKANQNILENRFGKSPAEDFEDQIIQHLNKIREDTKIDDRIDKKTNRFLAMTTSGSKGNTKNLGQIMSCLGQQVVAVKQPDRPTFKQQRIPYNSGKIKGGYDGRTLPHFHRHDDAPKSRGFCSNSFLVGLDPYEFFFHNASGREGLIDTAIKTADTGYLQRRLIKLMEDGKVYYDGTVRNSSRLILQFSYGCDGFEAIRLESDTICKTLYGLNDVSLLDQYKLSPFEDWTKIVDAKIRAEIKKDTGLEKLLDEEYEEIYEYRDLIRKEIFRDPVGKDGLSAKACDAIESQMPVKMSRLISNTRTKFKVRKKLSDLNPRYVVESVTALMDRLTGVPESASPYMKKSILDNRLLPRIIVRLHLASKRILTEYRLTKDMFDYVIISVEEHFRRAIAHPGDMVGIIAAQSLGQPTTQMTLNSVHYDTELLIDDQGKLKRVKIGDFVETHIEKLMKNESKKPDAIERHPNDTLLGHLEKDSNMRILACDEDGKIAWQRIEAVTRHPVVNEDGSNDVIKVTTHSGREVIATRGKSFLHRKDNKIVPIEGKDLEVGMYLPVSKILPIEHLIDHLEVADYLSKSEFLFMSEVDKALISKEKNGKFWWTEYGGFARIRGKWKDEKQSHGVQDFELPYKRGDTFCEAFLGRPGASAKRAKNCKPHCVYPRVVKQHAADVPEKLILDEQFGFFVGAYLAEGGCTDYHLMISNLDDDFNDKIDSFCRRINLNYHIQDQLKNNGRSKTLRTHSLVLTRIFTILFGNGAANKRIPAELLAAPIAFIKGIMNGYFSGDGCVHANGTYIVADSISKGLLVDITQLLARFDISGRITSQSQASLEKVREKYPNARQMHHLYLSIAQTIKFAAIFNLVIVDKQARLDLIRKPKLFDDCDQIPDIITKTWGVSCLKRSQLDDALDQAAYMEDKRVIQRVLDEDIMYDQIRFIERLPHDRPFIYDLTVAGPRTFNIYSGLTNFDTFHQAGQATQFNVVDGVPRLEELISASAKPKAPQITIYLNQEFIEDEDRAEVVRNKLRQTRLSDLAKSSEIVYDPSDENTLLAQDKEFLRSYYLFMQENSCNFDSAWVLRLELDKEKMLERNIRMWEIEQALIERFTNEIQCIFADDNAKQLIVRIRVSNEAGMDRPDEDQDIIFLLKQLEKSLMDSLVLRGIEGIKNAFIPARETRPHIESVSEDGGMKDSDRREIVIIAEQSAVGESSLLEIFKIPEVDETRTMSNYVGDVLALLGIEAARNMLFREILQVFSTSDINHRHIEMLVDTMTCRGDLTKINRMGINKLNVGPLARCSFEETETQFMNAAAFAEEDTFRGVSSNTMLGQYYPGGTGECEVLLDEDMLTEHLKTQRPETIQEDPEEEESALAEEQEQHEDLTDAQLDFDFSLDDTVTAPFS